MPQQNANNMSRPTAKTEQINLSRKRQNKRQSFILLPDYKKERLFSNPVHIKHHTFRTIKQQDSMTPFRENYKRSLGSGTMVTKRDMKPTRIGSIKNRTDKG